MHAPRQSLLEKLGLHRPELRAWAAYDWANSAMIVVVNTAIFPLYYREVVAPDASGATRDYAFATTIALALAALLAPALGTLVDARPLKRRLLVVFAGIGSLSTAGLALTGAGDRGLALSLYALANLGAVTSFVFYDALLPHVAKGAERDRVSSSAYALGYLGGGVFLAAAIAVVMSPERFGLVSAAAASRVVFAATAIWWMLFTVPLLRRVEEPPVVARATAAPGAAVRRATARLGAVLHELRAYPQALLMLVAFLLYNDGIQTVYRMAALYGSDAGIDSRHLMLAILLVQFVGVPCALAFGPLAGRFGAKACILGCIAAYFAIVVLAFRMRSAGEFYALALGVAAVQGGAQALSRSLFAGLVPRQRAGEFFGFFAVAEKFAGIFGPLCFGLAEDLFGTESRFALLSLIGFFALGGYLLSRVDVDSGRSTARAAEAQLGG